MSEKATPYTLAEVDQLDADNEAAVFPDTVRRRLVATIRQFASTGSQPGIVVSEEGIAVEHRPAFRRLIDHGEMDDGFAAYLDANPDAQAAVERAFQAILRGMREFGRQVRKERAEP